MNFLTRSRLAFARWTAIAIFVVCPLAAQADDPAAPPENPWGVKGGTVQFSLYTRHFQPEPEHVNNQKMIAGEIYFNNNWLIGAAIFDNSFGQNSQYVYMGKSWKIRRSPYWYFKLTGGLLHGYKEPYEDKIPLNGMGVAPAIVPALGFRYRWFATELHLAGLAAVTWTAGIRFD